MIKAVIFDFDGLILNSEKTEYLSWQEVYTAYGVPFPEAAWQANIGAIDFDPYAALELQVGHSLDRTAVQTKRRQRDHELLMQESILPGVADYLIEARQLGLRIGLASSSPHHWIDGHLQRLELLPFFDAVACRDDVQGRAKPDPAVYQFVLARLGVQPAQALALEDSLNGVRAALAAGVWVTAVPHALTQSLNFDLADFRLHSLADMTLSTLIHEVLNGNHKL